ncbi:EAL domain-containing protein [Sutcliffiella sp. NPDC057660]|uniref:EAL domain-containing protein n=1 Tax=Sutcliffiella sp. NPDC057660 TaxID=3346199 RepID=UPI003679AEFA
MKKIQLWGNRSKQQDSDTATKERLVEERLFHSLFDYHPHPVILVNAQGEIVKNNKRAVSQFGYKQKELTGDFTKFIPHECLHEVAAKFQEALKGLSLTYETKILHKNKLHIDVSVTSVPIMDDTSVIGIYVVIRNIEKEKQTQNELKSVKSSLRLMQNTAKLGNWHYDISTMEMSWSNHAYDILGIEKSKQYSFTFEVFFSMIHPDDQGNFRSVYDNAMKNQNSCSLEYRFITPCSGVVHIFVNSDIVLNDLGVPTKFIGTIMDITEMRTLEKKLETIDQEMKEIYDNLDLGVWAYDVKGKRFTFVSKTIEKMVGLDVALFENGTVTIRDIICKQDLPSYDSNLRYLYEKNTIVNEYRIVLPNGEHKWVKDCMMPILDENRQLVKINGILTDITEHKELLEKVEYLANHDYLTGLPNRRLLKEEMEFLIQNYDETEQNFAVLYIDLDRFKYINDTLGHPVGDNVLKIIADRLTVYQQEGHFVARVGGDEFIIVYQGSVKIEELKGIAKDLITLLREPVYEGEYELYLTACVGVSVFPFDGEMEDTLLKHADVALFRAKELGKNYFEIYTPNINVKTYQQFTIERDMHKALKEDQFTIYFQPKVNAQTYQIVGAEALIRWEHPLWGMLSPGEFIPIAEETGMINEIGDYVMEKVLQQISTWTENGVPVVPISINVSPQRFLRKNYYQLVESSIKSYGVDPKLIELEITESSFLHNPEVVLKTVRDLRNLGVKVALDDFGTGYSSMTRLTELEIDVLKVDRSFVKDVETNRKNAIILESLFVIAKDLDIEVVVEGVETEGQLLFMKQKNCDIIQGYIFSKPVPISPFTDMLEKRKLLPQKTKAKLPSIERREYFRIDFPNALMGELTVKEIRGKEVQLGQVGIVLENIGPGGMRIISHMQFPVRPDLIVSIRTSILGETRDYIGKIVWKEEGPETYFYYGVEFMVDENERTELTGFLNRVTLQLKDSHTLPQTSIIQENKWDYLERLKGE